MGGIRNEVLAGKNVDFTGADIPTPQMVSNGQLLIGSAVLPNIRVGSLVSPDSSITFGYVVPNIHVTVADVFANQYTTDSGVAVPSGKNLNVLGSNGLQTIGSSSTVTIEGIDATAGTSLSATKGVASFDQDYFTVASGFVSLIGSPEASLSPYIVGPTNSDYTTIQAAIDQAVLDGASAVNQINIYIKPGEYTENITLSGGINLIAFTPSWQSTEANVPTSYVNGTVTVTNSSGPTRIVGLGFNYAGNIFTFQSGNLILQNCASTGTNGDTITFTTSSQKYLVLDQCNFAGGSNTRLFNFTITNPTINIDILSCIIKDFSDVSNFSGLGGNFTVLIQDTQFDTCIYADVATFNLTLRNTSIVPISAEIFLEFSLTTLGSLKVYNCQITPNTQNVFSILAPNYVISTQNLLFVGSNAPTFTFGSNQSFDLFNYIQDQSNPIQYISNANTGYPDSGVATCQDRLQTFSNTVELLATISIAEGETCLAKGTLSASTSDFSKVLIGEFIVGVRREVAGSAAIVGNPYIIRTVNNTTAYFELAVVADLLELRVFGEAATSYFWVCEYSYQKFAGST